MKLNLVLTIWLGWLAITVNAAEQEKEHWFQGRVISVEKLTASPCCPGRIDWRADFGAMIRQGQPLFRLQDGELKMKLEASQLRVNKLESRLVQIQKRHERMKRLGENRHAGVAEVEDACFEAEKTRLELAEEQAELARFQYLMNERVFYAPYDGIVMETVLNAGDYVTSGKEVLKFEGLKREVEVWLPRKLVQNMEQATCSVKPEEGRLGVTLKKPRHALSADPSTGLFRVRFEPGADLRFSGEAVTVQCRMSEAAMSASN
ncbi:efflux RND transporter periplasmic adaptor subunit [Spongorhabdus nitratireducens]